MAGAEENSATRAARVAALCIYIGPIFYAHNTFYSWARGRAFWRANRREELAARCVMLSHGALSMQNAFFPCQRRAERRRGGRVGVGEGVRESGKPERERSLEEALLKRTRREYVALKVFACRSRGCCVPIFSVPAPIILSPAMCVSLNYYSAGAFFHTLSLFYALRPRFSLFWYFTTTPLTFANWSIINGFEIESFEIQDNIWLLYWESNST